MSEDRWRQTERIYQDALKIAPEKRAAFLEEACRNVADLKQDVEVLLAADSSSQILLTQQRARHRAFPI